MTDYYKAKSFNALTQSGYIGMMKHEIRIEKRKTLRRKLIKFIDKLFGFSGEELE